MLSPERWQIVEQVFHDALRLPHAEREAFVASSCAGDEDVRREVESLLAADSSQEFEPAAVERVVADWAIESAPATMAGREIGGYRVVSLLGEGGMGEVYLADDLSLGRRVAVKLLPLQFTSDAARLRRFTEEARAASALNHPNIITVHHIGEFDRRRYIVTEFIDGETLRSRMARGPLPETAAVDIAVQAATALRAAHDAGIVHRDIKPENLMIRRDGYVKVLDFGLAKLAPDEHVAGTAGSSQPVTPRTRVGAVLGTPHYMAPEQAKGAVVDARADIFSLSVVLHEMVAGALPGESGGGPKPSLELARALARGLTSDPAARYQRIEDLIDDLEALRAPVGWRARIRRWRTPVSAAAAAILIAVMGWSGYRFISRPPLISSMAVLPLANASGDAALDYLGEGIAEGVISKLTQQPRLKVMARSASFRFKGRENEPEKIGQELKVDAILTGRVVPQGDTARVEVRLIQVNSGRVLWNEGFAVRPAAVTDVEEAIAGRIVARLRLPSVANAARPMDPEAHTLYLKGRYQLTKRTKEGLRQAQLLFGQALERDPEQAVLHAGLAEAWALIGAYSVLPPADSFPRAIAAAREALERDESLAEARATLALCLFLYEWKWEAAEVEFRRVTGSQPGFATGHHWYGEYLMARGRSDEAVAALRRAMELDPLSSVIAVDVGRAYYFGRRFPEARAECARALEVTPGLSQAIECIATVDLAERRYEDALARYQEVSRQGIDAGPPGVMAALAGAGRQADAEAQLAKLGPLTQPGVQLILAIGFIGHKDDAFRLLDAARTQRMNNLVYLKTDPRADSLRGDPRWAEFARQVGLD